jgi:hypothetical protein
MATLELANDMNIVEAMQSRFNGNIVNVVKTLARKNELLINAPAVEANDEFTNVTARWHNLPKPDTRSINAGAKRGKLELEQVRESIMLLEQPFEIDEQLVKHAPDKNRAMMIQMAGRLEGAAQRTAEYLIYGNPVSDTRQCAGWATRRNALADPNTVGLGGSGSDTTSVYIVEWDANAFSLIYPRGSQSMGIEYNEKGLLRVTDSNNDPYWAYVSQLVIELGLMEVDPRCLQRIANIESAGATNNFIDPIKVRDMVYALNRLPGYGDAPGTFIYGNRSTKAQMDIYALEKSNGFYVVDASNRVDNVTSRPLSTFRGIPIRLVEAITDAETAIT